MLEERETIIFRATDVYFGVVILVRCFYTKVIYFSCANILLRTASISQIRFRNATMSGLSSSLSSQSIILSSFMVCKDFIFLKDGHNLIWHPFT